MIVKARRQVLTLDLKASTVRPSDVNRYINPEEGGTRVEDPVAHWLLLTSVDRTDRSSVF